MPCGSGSSRSAVRIGRSLGGEGRSGWSIAPIVSLIGQPPFPKDLYQAAVLRTLRMSKAVKLRVHVGSPKSGYICNVASGLGQVRAGAVRGTGFGATASPSDQPR